MKVQWQTLQQYSLFGGLDQESIVLILEQMELLAFSENQTLFTSGSQGDQVCFVVEGEVAIVKDGVELSLLREGEQFGEMYIVDIMPRSADVIGRQAGHCLSLKHRDLFKIGQQNPALYSHLLLNCSRDISRRLRIMNEKYVQLVKDR